MDDVIAEGDVVPVKVTFVNHAFFRLNVSYREARSDTSAGGSWVFDQRGRVMQIPAEASEAFPTSVRQSKPATLHGASCRYAPF